MLRSGVLVGPARKPAIAASGNGVRAVSLQSEVK
jgi:hypothetical protein